jgi:uncharacterized integral membrane protein (TIGR00697 family)
LRRTPEALNILTIIFIVSLVISNVITGKVIDTGITLFGNPVTIAGAVICYPVCYLITDIVGEMWGKREANKIVKYGFIGQVLATLIIVATTYTPYLDMDMQAAYVKLLGQNWVFVAGSLSAYLASQYLDVHIFHTLKEKTNGKSKWIRNNASTMLSQLVDTAIFIIIAFGFGFGWIFDNQVALLNMVIGQYLIKLIIAVLDTVPFYILTRERR